MQRNHLMTLSVVSLMTTCSPPEPASYDKSTEIGIIISTANCAKDIRTVLSGNLLDSDVRELYHQLRFEIPAPNIIPGSDTGIFQFSTKNYEMFLSYFPPGDNHPVVTTMASRPTTLDATRGHVYDVAINILNRYGEQMLVCGATNIEQNDKDLTAAHRPVCMINANSYGWGRASTHLYLEAIDKGCPSVVSAIAQQLQQHQHDLDITKPE